MILKDINAVSRYTVTGENRPVAIAAASSSSETSKPRTIHNLRPPISPSAANSGPSVHSFNRMTASRAASAQRRDSRQPLRFEVGGGEAGRVGVSVTEMPPVRVWDHLMARLGVRRRWVKRSASDRRQHPVQQGVVAAIRPDGGVAGFGHTLARGGIG
jgi:hypothetical protein